MITSRTRSTGIAVVASALLLAAACAGDGGDTATGGGGTDAGGATGPTTMGGGVGGAYGGTDRGDDGGGGGEDAGQTAATVQANNFLFAPANLEVEAGSEIEVENGNASTPHTFTVEGTDIDVELSPGDSKAVTVDLDPGSYAFVCRFHQQMTGTLTVT